MLRIRLYSPFVTPHSKAPYRLTLGTDVRTGTSDGDGWVEVPLAKIPDQCVIEWNNPPDSGSPAEAPPENGDSAPDADAPPEYRYKQTLALAYKAAADQDQAKMRLENLGHTEETLEQKIMAFQRRYQQSQDISGNLEDVRSDLQDWHDNADLKPLDLSNWWLLMV